MGIFGNLLNWVPIIGKPIGGLFDDVGNGLINGAGGLVEDVFDWSSSKIINPLYKDLIVPVAGKAGQIIDTSTNMIDSVFKYLPWLIAGTVIVAVVIPLVMK